VLFDLTDGLYALEETYIALRKHGIIGKAKFHEEEEVGVYNLGDTLSLLAQMLKVQADTRSTKAETNNKRQQAEEILGYVEEAVGVQYECSRSAEGVQ
jgi:hypothetical protein